MVQTNGHDLMRLWWRCLEENNNTQVENNMGEGRFEGGKDGGREGGRGYVLSWPVQASFFFSDHCQISRVTANRAV